MLYASAEASIRGVAGRPPGKTTKDPSPETALYMLSYTTDGRLLDGERELVRLQAEGAFGVLSDASGEYELTRPGSGGWHMELTDRRTGQRACEFVPRLIGRGGRLRSADGQTSLRGRLLGPSHWRFSSANGTRVDATANAVRTPARGLRQLEVRLDMGEWVGTLPIAPLTLAFGCWLIVRWEMGMPQRSGTLDVLIGAGP